MRLVFIILLTHQRPMSTKRRQFITRPIRSQDLIHLIKMLSRMLIGGTRSGRMQDFGYFINIQHHPLYYCYVCIDGERFNVISVYHDSVLGVDLCWPRWWFMYARTSLLFESIITAITTKQLFLFQTINDNYYLCRRCEHSICYQAKLDVARQELQEGQGELVV